MYLLFAELSPNILKIVFDDMKNNMSTFSG